MKNENGKMEKEESTDAKGKDMNATKEIKKLSLRLLGVQAERETWSCWSDLKTLVEAFGSTEVVHAFEEWAAANEGEVTDKPVTLFCKIGAGLLKGIIVLKHTPEDQDFLVDLALACNNDIIFDQKQQMRVLKLLDDFSKEEILAALKEFYVKICEDKFQVQTGAKNFCEKARTLLGGVRKLQAIKKSTIALVEQTAARVKSESEKANAGRAAREAEEAALIEEDPFND